MSMSTQDFLTALYGEVPGSLIVISKRELRKDGTGDYYVTRTTETADMASRKVAAADATAKNGEAVYHRITTLPLDWEPQTQGSRGKAKESAASPGVFLDIDVATGDHKDALKPESWEAFAPVLAAAGLPPETSLVFSGGGFYPGWVHPELFDLTAPGAYDRYLSLQKSLHGLVNAWSQELGTGKVDSTFDLARVLRAPGSRNRKEKYGPDGILCEVVHFDGPRYTLEELEAVVSAATWPASAQPSRGKAAAAGGDDDLFSPASDRQFTVTREKAMASIESALDRCRSVKRGEGTNGVFGGAAREVARYVNAGVLTESEAAERLILACQDNPHQDPAWYGKDGNWTIESVIGRALTEGIAVDAEEGGRFILVERAEVVDEARLQFTDAHVSELVVEQLLRGSFLNVPGVSWLQWRSPVWVEVPDATVIEQIRRFAVEKVAHYDRIKLECMGRGDTTGAEKAQAAAGSWYGYCSAGKLKAVLTLAVGQDGVQASANEFDRDHHLLNTPGGVVDLRTGETMPAAPELRMTKVTSVPYIPGASSPAFKAALTAIPDGCEEWMQDRFGQAITGEHPDDGRFVLLTGGGANGKTTLMGVLMAALRPAEGSDEQGYGRLIPSELLLTAKSAGKDGATPTKMTLQGTRFGYFEETPEGRYLDVTAVKSIMDTKTITGRQLFQRQVTFGTTHSLFLNTNYPPLVEETGHGEWRRLVRIDFPYKFVSQRHADTVGLKENERVGSPTIKADLGSVEAREAALAWMVEGAIRFYARGAFLPPVEEDPAAVVESTLTWRRRSDVILQFLEECMAPLADNRTAWVERAALYATYKEWTINNGNKPLSMGKLMDRLTAHSALGWVSVTKRPVTAEGYSAAPGTAWLGEQARATGSDGRVNAVVGLAFA